MSNTTPFVYTQLDVTTRLSAVNARIRDLEQQYLQVSLRVDAPDLNAPVNEMDRQNLTTLQNSLAALHAMAQSLQAQIDNPTPSS